MSQEKIKSLMDKINLLMNVFMKDGLEKVSQLEKDLLKEQVHRLLEEVENLELKSDSGAVSPLKEEEIPSVKKPEESRIEKPAPVPPVIQDKPEGETPLSSSADETKNNEDECDEDVKVFRTNKPHRSLKSVIDLNKSFILKEELFGNKHEDYTSFINELAEIESEEESFVFMEKKKAAYEWDEEDKAYQLLKRAVEKRFLPLLQQ